MTQVIVGPELVIVRMVTPGGCLRIMAVVALVGAGIGAAWGQSPPQPGGSPVAGGVSIDSKSGARLPLPARTDMRDEASARIYDALAGPDGKPPQGALGIALYSPATAAGFSRVERYLLTGSALRGRLAALLTLVTAREMNLAYQWSVREAAARSSGLEAAVIEAIRSNGSVEGLSRADALLIDFGRQLYRNRHVQSTTFAALVNRLGRQGTFDAIMLLTYPAMAGVLERAVDQQPPQGWSARLPRIAGVGTPPGRPGEFVALPERPPLPSDVHEDSYYRFPLLARQDLDARSKDLFDRMVGPDRQTTPRGPVGMTFLSAELVEPVQDINTALRTNGVLGTRLAEIVIAATGREMNSQYQWTVHGAAAAAAGAGPGVLDAIRSDGPVTALDQRDAVAIEFTRQIFREETVRPETFDRAVQLFGVRGTVEIAAVIGDYLMVTTMYNALGMRLRPEQAATLPHRAGAPVGAEWR
jgi:4-carboxymuconolactone decarboxylase